MSDNGESITFEDESLFLQDLFQTDSSSSCDVSNTIEEEKEESSNTHHSQIIHQELYTIKDNNPASYKLSGAKNDNNPTENSYFPLTMELRVDSMHDLLVTAERESGGRFLSKIPFCLIGLHTCGDLGSTALRFFTDVSSANALCMVGCCYHHITEREASKKRMSIAINAIILLAIYLRLARICIKLILCGQERDIIISRVSSRILGLGGKKGSIDHTHFCTYFVLACY